MSVSPAIPSEPGSDSPTTPQRVVRLTPLTGIRFFAAIHLLIFHLGAMPSPDEIRAMMAQQSPSPGESATAEPTSTGAAPGVEGTSAPEGSSPKPEASVAPPESDRSFDEMAADVQNRGIYKYLPQPISLLFQRGYTSSGLFFMLSGVVLSYLYVDGEGRQTIGNREFLLSRWIRLYPLHMTVLCLLIPFTILSAGFLPMTTLWGFSVSKTGFLALTGLMSFLLVQAWCPEAALTWNFATWALSAVAFFYVAFPPLVKWLRGQSRTTLWVVFWLQPILSLIPSFVYLRHYDQASMTNLWSEVVMRLPLFWLPSFIMALVLCRLYRITRHDMSWSLAGQAGAKGPGWGDLAALILIIACMTPDAVFQKLFFLGDKSPHFIIRHGLLFPVQALLIYQLALNRGWVARLLSHPVFEKLGEASFGIFIFQGLMIIPIIMGFTALGPSLESWLQKFSSDENTVAAAQEFIRLGVSVGAIVGLSLLSLRYFERPVARWLKQKFGLRSSAA